MSAKPAASGRAVDRAGRSAAPAKPDGAGQHAPSRTAYAALIGRGTVALALGITLLAAGANLSRLTTFVAVYWIVAALVTVRFVRSRPTLRHRRLTAAAGAAGIIIGATLLLRALFKALLSEGVFLDLLGLTAIATGILRLAGLIQDDQLAHDGARGRYRFVVGALEVWLGVTLLVAGSGGSTATRIVLGLWGLAMGIFLLLDGFTVRRLAAQRASAS